MQANALQQDKRFYAVWKVRGETHHAGVHVGIGASAYHGLIALAGSMGGLRWRRCSSLPDAVNTYLAEAGAHGASLLVSFFHW